MADRDSSDDSDAPEEFTAKQAAELDEKIQKEHKENTIRVDREKKERRKLWAQRKTPRSSKKTKRLTESELLEEEDDEEEEQHSAKNGMLPSNIVDLLAAREKQVFLSDSEDEKIEEKTNSKKKKRKSSGQQAVILSEITQSHCLQNSLEFLKRKKMEVPRSTAVLQNSTQALRLISSSGLLGKN
ncbi:hypothetical protein ACHQM5_023337 [Ranunculus cassubicifolius]